jgi:hypothetical protein
MDSSKRSQFTETLWQMDEKSLIDFMKARVGQPDFQTALAVLNAKSLIASREVATWTKRLTWATFALAALALLAIVVD